MSLFKTRLFWKIECDVDEKFDQNCMLISKFNSPTDFIIIGSHNGILRIFNPNNDIVDGVINGYQSTDLFIEKLFATPILQLSSGRLVSGSKLENLAILHPKSVAVYSIVSKEGLTNHGAHNQLQLMYEHKLTRSAANFVVGLFGGSQTRDFICVQSLDGMLTFFEQETFVFCCFLPEFLLPGPLVYVRRSDSFITVGSNWSIDSYRYKLLSEIGENSNQEDVSGKKVKSDWSFNLGEGVLDIQTISDENVKESFIAILGERNYYCLTQNGKLKLMKRLEYPASCFHVYSLDNKLMTLIASETNTLLIYQETTLKWSAQLNILPIAIGRAFLKNVLGAIVLLSEEGSMELNYLGTEPSIFSAPPISNQPLDFEKAEQELSTLSKMINSNYANDVKLTNENAERELMISLLVNPHLETSSTENSKKLCEVLVDVLPQAIFEEVQLAICVQKPLTVTPNVMYYSQLSDRAKFHCYISVEEELPVPSLEIEIKTSFVTSLGVPRVITKTAILPLTLVVETYSPMKESIHKITLNINKDLVPLSKLFSEYAGENSVTLNSNAIGFKFLHEDAKPVSILTAKTSQRYRIQSDCILSINIILQEIVRRLKQFYSNSGDFLVSAGPTLLSQPILEFVKNHFEVRQSLNRSQIELSQLSTQFRLIQKRLLSKFKDKNPSPLTKLEILLNDTNEDIAETSSRYQELERKLNTAQIELSCAMQYVITLLKLTNEHNSNPLVGSVFSPFIYDMENQNWEDVMDAGLCNLLRTVLAKSEKDRLRAAHTSFDVIKDISKVEKHLTSVIERLVKKNINFDVLESEEKEPEETKEVDHVPIGTKIAESSSRILSAKVGAHRKIPEKGEEK